MLLKTLFFGILKMKTKIKRESRERKIKGEQILFSQNLIYA